MRNRRNEIVCIAHLLRYKMMIYLFLSFLARNRLRILFADPDPKHCLEINFFAHYISYSLPMMIFSIQCLGTPFMIARRKSCRGRTRIRRHMLQSLDSIHRGRTRICRHKLWSLDSLHLSELTFLKLMPQEAKLTRGRRYLVLVLTSAGIFRPVFLPNLVPIYKMWVIITAY